MLSLSVICVTFKDPEGLRATLESLRPLAGTPFLKEVIVVDSSPELSGKTLAENQNLPIVHIPSPPEGIYAAMNLGAARSAGEVLWFLNGGDRLHDEHALPALLHRLEERPEIDLVSGTAKLYRQRIFRYDHPAPIDWMHGLSGERSFCHQALLYRASSIKKILPYSKEFRLAADYDLHLRAFLAGLSYEPQAQAVVAYDTSGASSNSKKVMDEMERVLQMRLASVSGSVSSPIFRGYRKERQRQKLLRFLRAIPGSRLLQPLWLAWNRRG